jgi:enoyl-CoA hydratase/carnithine racemase
MKFTTMEMNGKIATLTLSNPRKLNSLSKGAQEMRGEESACGALEG